MRAENGPRSSARPRDAAGELTSTRSATGCWCSRRRGSSGTSRPGGRRHRGTSTRCIAPFSSVMSSSAAACRRSSRRHAARVRRRTWQRATSRFGAHGFYVRRRRGGRAASRWRWHCPRRPRSACRVYTVCAAARGCEMLPCFVKPIFNPLKRLFPAAGCGRCRRMGAVAVS